MPTLKGILYKFTIPDLYHPKMQLEIDSRPGYWKHKLFIFVSEL